WHRNRPARHHGLERSADANQHQRRISRASQLHGALGLLDGHRHPLALVVNL
ncbi:MAG: hypothetical protein ACJAV2_002907, partial [Myxococcota bacterium]